MYERFPWTREELQNLIPHIEEELDRIEGEEQDEVRPIPQMTESESVEYLDRLMKIAKTRPLTSGEVFMHSQLLSVWRMAIQAEVLGHDPKKRYIVFCEDDINRLKALGK